MAKGWLEVGVAAKHRRTLRSQQLLFSTSDCTVPWYACAGVQIQLLRGNPNIYDRSLRHQSRQIGCDHKKRKSKLAAN